MTPPYTHWTVSIPSFMISMTTDGKVYFVPHQLDSDSGVGRLLATGDINGDGAIDIVVGNKLGTFVFLPSQ